MPHSIRFVSPSASIVFRRIKTRLPDHEAVVLKELDLHIQNAKAGVKSRIDILNARRLQDIHKGTSAIGIEVHTTRSQLCEVSQGVKTVMKTCQELKDEYKQGRLRLSELLSTVASKNDVAAIVQTEFFKLASGLMYRTSKLSPQIWTLSQAHSPLGQPLQQIARTEIIAEEEQSLAQQTILMTIEELLWILGVDLEYLIRETERILRQSNSLRAKGLGKARWLLTTAQFKNWLGQSSSGTLLVDGYCRDDGIGRISPLSVLCASLATTLAQTGSSIVLHFFCSSHTRVEQDVIGGPSGLVRSLITQLLLYPDSPDVELDPLEENLYNAVSQCDVPALVYLFGSIVGNMDESKTIVCIIDGISDFETPLRGWDKEIIGVVDQLQNLVHCKRSGPALKLLMTSANKTLNLGSLVYRDRGEFVSLRSGNVSDRPVRGFGFDRDVARMLMPSSQQSDFLEPGGWGAQRASQREFAYVGRPRSSGSNVPGG